VGAAVVAGGAGVLVTLVTSVEVNGIALGASSADRLATAAETLLSAEMLAARLDDAAAAWETSLAAVEVTVG